MLGTVSLESDLLITQMWQSLDFSGLLITEGILNIVAGISTPQYHNHIGVLACHASSVCYFVAASYVSFV